ARIRHPNIAAVHDLGRIEGIGCIEMEFVRGISLAAILEQRPGQPVPLSRVWLLLEPLCSVLERAHNHVNERTARPEPILHLGLKPSNLIFVKDDRGEGAPQLKVLDFGIFRLIEGEGTPLLSSGGHPLGTPAYMSPEQIRGGIDPDGRGHELDARSDLYSTGV